MIRDQVREDRRKKHWTWPAARCAACVSVIAMRRPLGRRYFFGLYFRLLIGLAHIFNLWLIRWVAESEVDNEDQPGSNYFRYASVWILCGTIVVQIA